MKNYELSPEWYEFEDEIEQYNRHTKKEKQNEKNFICCNDHHVALVQ
jgi:hypothetical protein